MRIVILEKLQKYTKSILGKKQNKTTYYKSVQNTSLLANTVLILLTKNKTSDRGLVLLGTAINM